MGEEIMEKLIQVGSIYIDLENYKMIDYDDGHGVNFDFENWTLTTNKNSTSYAIRYDDKTDELVFWKNGKEGWISFTSEGSVQAARILIHNYLDNQIITETE
jgi:hypothetical protein